MVSRKSKRPRPNPPGKSIEEEEAHNDPPPSAFQVLFSDLQSPQGLSQSVLNRCYLLLNHLSLCPPCTVRIRHGDELNDCNEETSKDCHDLVTDNIVSVSDLLFKELSERFEKCSLSHDDYTSASDQRDSFGIISLLLRCCLVLLTLPEINQEYLSQKGQVVLGILRRLRLVELKGKKVSQGCGNVDAGSDACSSEDYVASLHFIQPSKTCLHFLSAMHEVILDELLMHSPLRSFIKLIDSFYTPIGLLSMSKSEYGDVQIMLEVILSHFSLSVSDNEKLDDFLNRLFLAEPKFRPSLRPSEVSLSAATVLLCNPIILSAPEFMQAHIFALISEAFSNSFNSENLKPDCRIMSCLLTVLEKSVVLYKKNIHNFHPDLNFKDSNVFAESEDFRPSFESFILPETRNKMDCLISKLSNCSRSYVSNMANKTKTDIISTAISYIKECRDDVFDKSFKDEIFSILTRVVTEASGRFEYAEPNASIQSLCILGSVLKLMSTVLLKAVAFMRYNNGDQNHPKCLNELQLCKEYNDLMSIISCFERSGVHLPVQQFLCDLMKTTSFTKHEISKKMFLHFSELFSLSLSTGLDFLIKGSLSVLTAVMNLFVFEEGNLNVFCELYASEPGRSETSTKNKNSRVVALKFLRTRTLCPRSCKETNSEKHEQTEDGSITVEEQTVERSNGEIYLNLILQPGEKVDDFDDLASFIECDPEKDYPSWYKNRREFRMWKENKMDNLRWKKKMKTWRNAKSKP